MPGYVVTKYHFLIVNQQFLIPILNNVFHCFNIYFLDWNLMSSISSINILNTFTSVDERIYQVNK